MYFSKVVNVTISIFFGSIKFISFKNIVINTNN